MGQYNTPDDDNLDTIIRQLQEDVKRLQRQTRAVATSVDSGDFNVKGGGSVNIADGGGISIDDGGSIAINDGGSIVIAGGGQQIIDGAVIRPLLFVPDAETFGNQDLPTTSTYVVAGTAPIVVPTWANFAVIIATAQMSGSVYRSSPAFDSGISVMNLKISATGGIAYGGIAAPAVTTSYGSIGDYFISQTANYTDFISGIVTGGSTINVRLSANRTDGTSGSFNSSLKVVGLFTRQ